MKVSVNIKVRNEEWFDRDEESQVINEGKISKYTDFLDFEFNFEVKKYEDNRSAEYGLKLFLDTNESAESVEYILQDVTVIKFIGDNDTCDVVVSNSLVREYFGAVKRGGRFYWYFYIHENVGYARLGDNIWVDEKTMELLLTKYPSGNVLNPVQIKRRKHGGVFTIYR